MKKFTAAVEIITDEDAMWGNQGCEGYNHDASVQNYIDMVAAEISESYGDILSFEVTEGNGRIEVWNTGEYDPRREDIEGGIRDIITNVWSAFEWIVEEAA